MDTLDLYLHAVSVHEEEVYNITTEALASFDTNLKGPCSYRKMYEAYLQILHGDAESAMMKFMKTDPFPLLKVCEIKHLHLSQIFYLTVSYL
jgi:hypothetical protein